MWLSKIARTIWDILFRSHPPLLYQGYPEGERPEFDDSVLFYDQVKRHLAYVHTGAYCLLVERPTDSGKWMTRTYQFSNRRRNFLIEMIATHLTTHCLMKCASETR